jgi:D-beta-D-heptose 7-phosphate kinase/D-beta-D-heptose 1-phosphate adenosyltransferase
MSDTSLNSIIDALPNTKVLVVGDIMLDRFVYGSVDRISPESPVPVLAVAREDFMLGGAGNALSNLAGLGAKAEILSVIGDDEDGKAVCAQVEKLGYSAEGLIVDSARPTIVKTRYLAGHQQLLRTDFEKKDAISDAVANDLVTRAKEAIARVGAEILSDYGKGLLRADVIAKIIAAAHMADVPVIVDPKGTDFSIYKGASAITPNKKELSEATQNSAVSTDEEVIAAAETLIHKCGIEAVVATRSSDGMSVIQKSGNPTHLQTTDIEVFDVSGAGDSVIATIAASLASGASLVDAARLANIAGSIVVTKVGTAPIRLQELTDALQGDQGDAVMASGREREKVDRARRGDVMGWAEAAEQVQRWKARGLKVGFTNGCFDILHFGHVTYLNDARDHCDRLIMGLNKDSSIRILKGPERPVHNEESRAQVIAALGSIDMVVLFGAEEEGDDNTACALLDALKPDVYFKGGDYTVDQIPEAPTVMKNGGEVNVMPVYDGHSTTSSIARIKAGEKDAA